MRITLEEAVRLVRENAPAPGTETLPLADCLGRRLAEPFLADRDQPPFARSTMDGYALTAEDLERLGTGPIVLPVTGTADAGDTADRRIRPGEAIRIMTGARVPEGAAAVVPQEQTDQGSPRVRVFGLPERANIAPVGEDFCAGDVLAPAGCRVDPSLLACAASCGRTALTVKAAPRVTILTTGDELVPPGQPLLPGQIYDSSLFYFGARLKELGASVTGAHHAGDDLAEIRTGIEAALSVSGLILTTGGVSVGRKDLMEEALRGMGAEILFHGIRIKPGMPTMAALLEGRLVLALSGNPYAAAALLEALYPYREAGSAQGSMAEAYRRPRPVPRLLRGRLEGGRFTPAAGQLNGVMAGGIGMNCLALLPEGEEAIEAGTPVRCLMLNE